MSRFDYTSRTPEETLRLGRVLGTLLEPGDVICLSGDLGAGKTVLTQGIGAGWGALEPVTSPTFMLIHEHRRKQNDHVLYHVDSYRLGGAADAWGIGLEDLWHYGGCLVIEWPENIAGILPDEKLWITLETIDTTQRHISLHGSGKRYESLVDAVRRHFADNNNP